MPSSPCPSETTPDNRLRKAAATASVIAEEREINLNEIISFLLPNGLFYLLSPACQAGLGRLHICVMEEGKKIKQLFSVTFGDLVENFRSGKFSLDCLPGVIIQPTKSRGLLLCGLFISAM